MLSLLVLPTQGEEPGDEMNYDAFMEAHIFL
jgi:hypothetical protein